MMAMGIDHLAAIIRCAAAFTVVATASVVSAATCYANLPQSDFANCTNIAPTVAVHWQVSPDESFITFGVDTDYSGSDIWFALGLSDMGGMRGSDIWWMRKDSASGGKWTLYDAYASDFATPVIDTQQDTELLIPPTDSKMMFTFKRALATCDLDQDIDIQKDIANNIIWATGQGASSPQQHSPNSRGGTRLYFQTSPELIEANAADPSDAAVFQIRMPNVTIPSNTTSYLCTHFEIPVSDKKYQVYKYTGVAKSKYVHHMIIFGCDAPPVAPDADGDLYNCASMGTSCTQFTFAWVPGISDFVYPPDAGVAIGSGPNARSHFALQVHYNNIDQVSGVVDNSGFDLSYTALLRPHDVGVLQVGSSDINIPGNSTSPTVLAPNSCSSECTSKFGTNLTVIQSGIHMHLLGLNQTTRHIRNGVELAPLSTRKHYDFNFQGKQPIMNASTATIMPGDTLITTCSYIPTAGIRTTNTQVGEASTSEMCWNFIQYYPKIPIEQCWAKRIGTDDFGLCTNVGASAPLQNRSLSTTDKLAIVNALQASGDIIKTAPETPFQAYAPQCSPKVRIGLGVVATTPGGGPMTRGAPSDASRLGSSVWVLSPVGILLALFTV